MELRLFRWLYTRSAWWRWEASTTMCYRYLHFLLQNNLNSFIRQLRDGRLIKYLKPISRKKQNYYCLQGFHRYSTDSSWHVPHFEKMLYDQAQLAVAYITASQVRAWIHHAVLLSASNSSSWRDARQPAPSLPENRSEAANVYTSSLGHFYRNGKKLPCTFHMQLSSKAAHMHMLVFNEDVQ